MSLGWAGRAIPRQQFRDAIDFVIGDAGEDIAEVGFWVEAVELCGFDERVDGGGAFSTGIRSGKEIILAAEGDAADRTLGGIVVDLDLAIVDVACQRFPATHGVTHGLGEIGFAGELRQRDIEPRLETGEERLGVFVSRSLPLIGWPPADTAFNGIECADAVERLLSKR